MKESKKSFQKFLWFTIALCVGLLSITTFSFAQGGFEDDFSGPTLDYSAWEVWPGWNNSYGSYSITNGALQYTLSPWQHDAAYYDTPSQSGGYTYYPGLLLARKFSGEKWTFETKINYNMPWSNGRGLSTAISIGNDGVRPSRGRSGEAFYILIYRNADQAGYGASANKLYMYAAAASNLLATVELPLSTTYETYYFKIIRDGYQFTLQYSADGVNYTQAFIVTAPASIDGKVQKVVIGGNSWGTPAGSYIAYDYIKVGEKHIVEIDPGHGKYADSQGNIHYRRGQSPTYNTHEDEFNLWLGRELKEELKKENYPIHMTRKDEWDLRNNEKDAINRRVELANKIHKPKPEIFVSIHCNAPPNNAKDYYKINGTLVFYQANKLTSQKSKELAGKIFFELTGIGLKKHDTGVKNSAGAHAVTRDTTMPAVLVETAFFTNNQWDGTSTHTILDEDRLYYDNERSNIVGAICNGIREFFK